MSTGFKWSALGSGPLTTLMEKLAAAPAAAAAPAPAKKAHAKKHHKAKKAKAAAEAAK
jgi:ribosomal protein L12E/L44/L45/RPP1/RPP2